MAAPKKAMPKPSTATKGRRKMSEAEISRKNAQIDKAWDILERQERRLGGNKGIRLQVRNPEPLAGGGYRVGDYSRTEGFYSGTSRQKIKRMTESQIRAEVGANRGSGTRKPGSKNKGF